MFGIFRKTNSPSGDGWQPISTAPKDGSTIEVRCTYGVAPWYGIFRWQEEVTLSDGNGGTFTFHSPGWRNVREPAKSFTEGESFSWRPYGGTSDQYVDPTAGAQDTKEYWLQAVRSRR